MKTETICISHREDPDGVISAVLIKQLFNADVFLTDYAEFMKTLQSVIKNYNFKQIFICDLALKLSNIDEFFNILSKIKQTGAKMWFVDHHMLPEGTKKRFDELDVLLLHQETDCTSAIIYENFKDGLKRNAELLTVCACITDNMENGKIAQQIIKNNEKMFALLNSALIWYSISKNQHNVKELYKLLNYLHSGRLPFEIIKDIDGFQNLLAKEFKLIEHMDDVRHYKNFDCLKIHNNKLSNFATRLLSKSEKTICLVHRDFDSGSAQELVIISSNNKDRDLGLITNVLSKKFGGSGGGDPAKSAAIIPNENFDNFLTSLDLKLVH